VEADATKVLTSVVGVEQCEVEAGVSQAPKDEVNHVAGIQNQLGSQCDDHE
jgi:hypothetical protein